MAARMERQAGRSKAVCRSVAGCPGASQSFGLRRQASWLKVWRGGGCKFSATEAHKRNGDRIDAEWRLPSSVTKLGVQLEGVSGVESFNVSYG